MNTTPSYRPHRPHTTEQIQIRNNVPYRIRRWAAPDQSASNMPALLFVHGWMDIGASFQRCIDHLNPDREIMALDWRGFGGSRSPVSPDSYWFYDYYADLDAIIDVVSPNRPIDLLGHSMGGNIASIYAGTCPQRIRRLINVEGFGLPRTSPADAPDRLAHWLSELKTPVSMRTFASVQDVAHHLGRRSPHIEPDFAIWLAQQWTEHNDADGRWHVAADPIHKRVNPILYRHDEVLACWENIKAPVLWVEGDQADKNALSHERYSRQEFESRLSRIASLERIRIDDCGHMVHLDQPKRLANAIERFLER